MSRARMIKPEFWTSKTISSMGHSERLLFIGLWNHADDYGVVLYNLRRIMGDVFPHDEYVTETKLKAWIEILMRLSLVIHCNHKGNDFLIIRGWDEHQRVPHPSGRRFLPEDVQLQVLSEHSCDPHENLMTPSLLKDKREKIKEKREMVNIPFPDFWIAYDKKVGDKSKLEKKWNALKDSEREAIMAHIPKYKQSKPDKQFRKDPATYLNNKSWNDEIIAPKKQERVYTDL